MSAVGDNVVFGGGVAVRQFVRIGEGAMIVGLTGIRADVIPYGMAHGPLAHLVGLNVVGMRRRGLSKARYPPRARGLSGAVLRRRRVPRAARARRGATMPAIRWSTQIIDFIRAGKRPLTMAIKRGEADEDA